MAAWRLLGCSRNASGVLLPSMIFDDPKGMRLVEAEARWFFFCERIKKMWMLIVCFVVFWVIIGIVFVWAILKVAEDLKAP